jgi:hypothetical protein
MRNDKGEDLQKLNEVKVKKQYQAINPTAFDNFENE